MTHIKKIFAFLLVFAFCTMILVGCAKEEPQQAGHVSDFDSQAHFTPETIDDESGQAETSKGQSVGEFVVSEKKYDYNNANLMLLSVENQTNTHYNITIKGKYLDENGETIKEETQIYECFPAGWQNYFIFYPKVAFDKFTYTLETEKYQTDALTADKNGVPYATQYELTYGKKLQWEKDIDFDVGFTNRREVRILEMFFTLVNHHPTTTIAMEFQVLVLDEQGSIYVTDFEFPGFWGVGNTNGTDCSPIGGIHDGKHEGARAYLKMQDAGIDETIPENVQGKFTAIFAINWVADGDIYFERHPLGG